MNGNIQRRLLSFYRIRSIYLYTDVERLGNASVQRLNRLARAHWSADVRPVMWRAAGVYMCPVKHRE